VVGVACVVGVGLGGMRNLLVHWLALSWGCCGVGLVGLARCWVLRGHLVVVLLLLPWLVVVVGWVLSWWLLLLAGLSNARCGVACGARVGAVGCAVGCGGGCGLGCGGVLSVA